MKPISVLVIVASMFVGCAKLDYVKVPTPTQYQVWTDEDQRRADAMKGVRYYLPRPFLHLKQSIPVAQRVALVTFSYDEQAKNYVLELPQDPPTWLKRVAPKKLSITQALAATVARGQADAGEQQSGKVGDEEEEEQPATNVPPSTLQASTGFINQSDPVTALSDKMDVVYLPDFEEQYIIQPKGGFGKVDIETRLRNGWAAEVFTQQVDNSNVIPYVIRQVESASEAAAGIVTSWAPLAAGLPPGTSPASLLGTADIDTGAAQLQSGDVETASDAVRKLLGQVLLFKIAEVRTAQPGIYPILKPREIRQWLRSTAVVSGTDPEETFELFLNSSNVPWIRPDMVFIPSPPYTMIGFNATTDVFLMPATDRATIPEESPPRAAMDELQSSAALDAAVKSIKVAMIKKNANFGAGAALINDQTIAVASTPAGGTVLTVTAPPAGQKTFTLAEAAIKAWAIDVFSPQTSSKINDADVTVSKLDGDKKIEISIAVPIADLAERATKVQ